MIVSLSMRVRYLNVALIKLAKLDPGYFPKHYFFDGLYWFEKLDKRNDNKINGSNIYSPYWVITCWVYTSFGFIQLDIFYEEIERTKLICTYILLKNSIPPNVIQLAGSILMTISTRSPIISVYGMFEATAGMFIKLITAMMIYIIIQLHISVSTSKS
ncbi:uncharacterized protein LOC135193893 [Vanessa tameamea]|uniref:Uncharacterized protein LOC135193893 n=1 Tax=Vanessa tameamea TaxID=334116 RepID=A0ABM4AST4_VANTA